ncbi:hypothetical protein RvY_17802 [Ramazzottius varieornatus]|uniref:Sulfotransferase domain-containing protein n=1 Tax=Ramazzottius varieornatus TaxID=947166 RepID=A0A1D1W3M9_RAMVA|nr:hypothetical protein RvY_17802 [Ramazzottius varieornatus]
MLATTPQSSEKTPLDANPSDNPSGLPELTMGFKEKDEVWSAHEAGLLDDASTKRPAFANLHRSGSEILSRVKFFLSTALHQVRCKWCVAVSTLLTAAIILASTISILPLGGMRDEGPIGPQLPPQMRPCRSKVNFSPDPLPKIALASFTGSGNTWLRGAIEQATGIWTGSSYPDNELYNGGFYGELVNDQKVIVIKTHTFGKKATKHNYQKAILLIRKPEDAILAKWNQYKTRTHTGIAKGESYDTREWEYFAPRAINEWKDLNEYWLSQNPLTLHVVHFEDLMKNKKEELRKILEFINAEVDEEMLDCVAEKYEGLFRRRKYTLDFEPFNADLKEQIENARDMVEQAIEEYKFSKSDMVDVENANAM